MSMIIDGGNVIHKCSLMCSYQYSYGKSACVVTTTENYIEFKYDENISKIYFNNQEYIIKNVRLYNGGIHNINGTVGQIEMIIHLHARNSMTKNLQICIPFMKKNDVSNANNMFGQIMKNLPDKNVTTSIHTDNFTLNHFHPNGAYYYYKGTNVVDTNDRDYDIIVFDTQVWLNISDDNYDLFNKKTTHVIYNKIQFDASKVYLNVLGTSVGNIDGSDDIYIDCQPTDDSADIVKSDPEDTVSTSILDEEKRKKMEKIIMIIAIILGMFIAGILLWFAFKKIGTIVNPGNNSIPTTT